MESTGAGFFNSSEPLGREQYTRSALFWLVAPFAWMLVLVFWTPLLVLVGEGGVLGFIVVALPLLWAFVKFVTLSARRLVDVGVSPNVALLAVFPGATIPLFVVLAIAPSGWSRSRSA